MSTVKFQKTPNYCDPMTVKDWLRCVSQGAFIDYDGHGYWATATDESNIAIKPSNVKDGKIETPEWATHVNWYNR